MTTGFYIKRNFNCPLFVHTKYYFKASFLAAEVFCVYNLDMIKKRGRPTKPPKERLEERLDVRVSEEEKAVFRFAAANVNQDLSVWIRVQLHRAASEQLPRRSDLRAKKGDNDGHASKTNADRVDSVR